MITLHITIASIIFSVMFAYRNFWQIQETWHKAYPKTQYLNDKLLNARKKWHKWQFALQIYIGVIITFVSFVCDFSLLNSLGHGLLFGSVFWLVFDTLLGYLLTNNLLHVDSNGIGTLYKRLAGKIIYLINHRKNKNKHATVESIAKLYNDLDNLAGYLLLISKVLFLSLSIIISVL